VYAEAYTDTNDTMVDNGDTKTLLVTKTWWLRHGDIKAKNCAYELQWLVSNV